METVPLTGFVVAYRSIVDGSVEELVSKRIIPAAFTSALPSAEVSKGESSAPLD